MSHYIPRQGFEIANFTKRKIFQSCITRNLVEVCKNPDSNLRFKFPASVRMSRISEWIGKSVYDLHKPANPLKRALN